MERQYRNLGYFLMVLVAFVAAGFNKPYFALLPNFGPGNTPLVQVHAILLMAFVAHSSWHRLVSREYWVTGSMSRGTLIGMPAAPS